MPRDNQQNVDPFVNASRMIAESTAAELRTSVA